MNAPDRAICLKWGLCPQTPGIYRFPARMTEWGGLSRPRHSGPGSALWSHPCVAVPSAQTPPIYTSSGSFPKKCLLKVASPRYKYSCPSSASLAGFQLTTYGRFSGDHRGISAQSSFSFSRKRLSSSLIFIACPSPPRGQLAGCPTGMTTITSSPPVNFTASFTNAGSMPPVTTAPSPSATVSSSRFSLASPAS